MEEGEVQVHHSPRLLCLRLHLRMRWEVPLPVPCGAARRPPGASPEPCAGGARGVRAGLGGRCSDCPGRGAGQDLPLAPAFTFIRSECKGASL